MNTFVNYWNDIPSLHRIVILLCGMVVFWLIKGYYPLFRFSYKRWKHAGVNFVFLGTTLLLNVILGILTIKICDFITNKHWGLLNWFHFPLWLTIIVGLLLGDLFGQYIPHLLMHKVKWM
jgi:sterol desaturase/sphingolipid hydroxylase (fatty acid hydroxylase superfamily)